MPGNAPAIEGRWYSPALYPQARARAPGSWKLPCPERSPQAPCAMVRTNPLCSLLKQFASKLK